MNKYIFLDIDGVLNSETDFIESVYNYNPVHSKLQKGERWKVINEGKLAILDDIVKQTGAKIVLSTTWRNHCDAKKLTKIFRKYGNLWTHSEDVIVGQTVDMKNDGSPYSGVPSHVTENEVRQAEIELWIEQNLKEEDEYIVIDDVLMGFGDRMIHTDTFVGLTMLQANAIMIKLGRLPKYQRKFNKQQAMLFAGIF